MLRLMIVAVLLLAVGGAGAGEIPQSELDADYSECMAGCGDSMDKGQCTNYCACVLQSLQERFDMDEYMAMSRAIATFQPGEPGSIAKLKGIVSVCEAEAVD